VQRDGWQQQQRGSGGGGGEEQEMQRSSADRDGRRSKWSPARSSPPQRARLKRTLYVESGLNTKLFIALRTQAEVETPANDLWLLRPRRARIWRTAARLAAVAVGGEIDVPPP